MMSKDTHALQGVGAKYTYADVRRWTSRKKVDIFRDLDIMIVPVNPESAHWSVGEANLNLLL
jgi:Ulp1 family protease